MTVREVLTSADRALSMRAGPLMPALAVVALLLSTYVSLLLGVVLLAGVLVLKLAGWRGPLSEPFSRSTTTRASGGLRPLLPLLPHPLVAGAEEHGVVVTFDGRDLGLRLVSGQPCDWGTADAPLQATVHRVPVTDLDDVWFERDALAPGLHAIGRIQVAYFHRLKGATEVVQHTAWLSNRHGTTAEQTAAAEALAEAVQEAQAAQEAHERPAGPDQLDGLDGLDGLAGGAT